METKPVKRKPGRPRKNKTTTGSLPSEELDKELVTVVDPVPLSQRRTVKDSFKEGLQDKDDSIHFNFGLMPGNSYRCLDCRDGFVLSQQAKLVCPSCGSKKLVPHSSDIVREEDTR